MDKDLKNNVEAILFASGRVVSLKELQQLTKILEPNVIKECVIELKHEYEDRDSPMMIVDEADGWKLSVKERYLEVVHSINPHTELSKSILETLAVIAWKQPALQSDVIKVRTNKAYDHIAELDKLGFLTKERHGRSYLLRVSKKFMDYFDLPDDVAIKDLFSGFKDIEVAVQKKVGQFEKDLPAKDKQAMEQRTDEELVQLAKGSGADDIDLETFDDELPPVHIPKQHSEVHVYSDDDSVKNVGQDKEVAEAEDDADYEGAEEGSGDGSSEGVSDKKDLDSEKTGGSETGSALEIAKQLLDEEKEEDSEESVDKRKLHPELEKMLDDTVQPKPVEEKVDSEEKGSGDAGSGDGSKEESGSVEDPSEDEGSGDDSDEEVKEPTESEDEQPKPAEEFPGQFDKKQDSEKTQDNSAEKQDSDEK